MKRILAATDFSNRSEQAVRRAALLAKQHGAGLALIHVVDDDRPARLVEIEHQAAALLVDERARALRDDGIETSTMISDGAPPQALLAAAAETGTDLIAIGAHRRHLLKDVFLGTTAERIIRQSTVPVLMVNTEPALPYRHMLIAVDLSDASELAVKAAIRLGFDRHMAVSVLYLFEAHAAGLMIRSATPMTEIRKYMNQEAEAAGAALRAFLKKTGVASIHPVAQPAAGPVAESICTTARELDADLIVVGTQGKTGMSRVMLGSVAEGVLRQADRDVLAVPSPLPG